jgi:CubicO group peptidase (beta-lactamase class C family)
MHARIATTAVVSTLVLALVAAVHAQRGNPELVYAGRSIDDMVAEYMREHDVPGLSLAIVQAPYITRASAYGVSDVATGRLTSPNTLFRVDGLARAYAAVAVMQLVEAGRLGLDEALRSRIPEAPAELTVRQLVGRRPSPEDALLQRRLIEQAAATSYEAFVRKNQIERLGLTRTLFASELAAVHRRAAGMRVQQSPYSPAETKARFERALGAIDHAPAAAAPAPEAEVWEENGEVWIAVADSVKVERGRADREALVRWKSAIDEALLRTVSP